ncbi:MAG: hypothetical protein WHT46_06920 [Candidatus Geothermincolales bacterium]
MRGTEKGRRGKPLLPLLWAAIRHWEAGLFLALGALLFVIGARVARNQEG